MSMSRKIALSYGLYLARIENEDVKEDCLKFRTLFGAHRKRTCLVRLPQVSLSIGHA